MNGVFSKVGGPWNFIAGKRCDVLNATKFMKVTQPATGKVLCEVPVSDSKDVENAVAAAKDGFNIWKQVPGAERGKLMTAAGHIVRKHLEDLVKLEVTDTGKPIWEARIDITSVADCLEYFGAAATANVIGQHIPVTGNSFAIVTREPLGICAGIGAWNFPMQTCVWKTAPALACGNSFIYKPSQFTPVTAVCLGEVLTMAGVPQGVFNVVQGEGETGALLCDHPDVAKVSFTGSVPTGAKVMSSSAQSIKTVTLELGGKSPLIIFPDADVKNAVKGTLLANFLSQGQVCSNGTRVFVHRAIYDEFIPALVEQTKRLKVGDPMDEEVTVGAAIHEAHAKRVLGYIEQAKKEGAVPLHGGERVILPAPHQEGHYLSPCILSECHDDMQVVRQEVFGSVLALLKFDSEEEVLKRANDTPFGLAGAVFSKDIQRAHRVSQSMNAGSVWVNTYNLVPPQVPFGGFKASGIGRECGLAALDFYSQTKSIYVEGGDVDAGPLYSEVD